MSDRLTDALYGTQSGRINYGGAARAGGELSLFFVTTGLQRSAGARSGTALARGSAILCLTRESGCMLLNARDV